MRLNDNDIKAIKNVAKAVFGETAIIWLFGSRTDDHKKGGDIDLFINNVNETTLTLEAKIRFLTELKIKIGDRKIDVVFDNANTRQKKNFYHSILRQKVKL